MIRIISYTHLLILVLSVGVLFGCNSDIVEQKRQAESRYIRINGYPKGFSEVEVSTRSGKNEFETKLSTLYMLMEILPVYGVLRNSIISKSKRQRFIRMPILHLRDWL